MNTESAGARVYSPINLRLVRALDKAEQLVALAHRPEIAAALGVEEFSPTQTKALGDNIALCRERLATFLSASSARRVATDTEDRDRRALVGLLQGVQSAAKRKWGRASLERDRLRAYYVGVPLKESAFATLAEAADAIVRQARVDLLPGYGTERLDKIEAAIVQWKASDAAQSEAQSRATKAHGEAETLWRRIDAERSALQHAADSAFPYTAAEHLAVRREFGLPKSGPYQSV